MDHPSAEQLPRLAEAGFGLIPLHHQHDAVGPRGRKVGKAPVGRDWWTRPKMTVEEAAAHMAEGGNVSIPLGKPLGGLYLCCYDVDLGNLPNGVKDVPRVVKRIAADLGVAVDDLVIHQSGNDGLHVFFLSGEADLVGHVDINGVKVEVKSRVSVSHFYDGRNEFWRRSFRSWLAGVSLSRKQFAVFAAYERPMKVHDRRRPQDDGGAE